MNRWISRLAPAVLFALPIQAARAQSTSAPPADPRAAAKLTYAKGNAFFNEAEQKHDPKLYEAAYLQYKQAFAIYPEDPVLWNLAATEIETKRYVDGLAHLREYDKHQRVSADPKHPKRKVFDDLQGRANAATGHLTVSTEDGAEVALDDVKLGKSPLTSVVDVAPGKHTLSATLGDRTGRAETEVAAGVYALVSVQLSAPPIPVVAAAPAPSAPAASSATPITKDSSTSPTPSFWNTRRVAGVVVAGTGLVALGVGAYFSGKSNDDASSVASLSAQFGPSGCAPPNPNPGCPALQDARDSQSSDHTLAIVFIGTGAAATLVGAAMVLWPSSNKEPARTLSVVPQFSPRSSGVTLQGAF